MKTKTAGPGRQPGNFLSKAKESYQRTLCAALGTSCAYGRCVNCLLFLGSSFRLCFVFTAGRLWFACFSAGLLQQWATSSKTKKPE
jgi:hypothetical protein